MTDARSKFRRPNRRAAVAALLLLVALGVRIAQVQRTSYTPINDAASYLKLASEIAQTGDYSLHGPGTGGSRGPSAYFPPGYPYFLAAVDVLDGHASGGRSAVRPARLAQALLGTVTVALTGLVAREALGETIALIALAIAAFYPVMIELSGVLVAENLLVALELGAVWCGLRAPRSEHPYRWIAAAGVLTGLATLTHQNAIVLLIPLALAAWSSSGRKLIAPAVLAGAAVLTIAPWSIRNAIVLHSIVPVSDETGITLAGTYNPVSAGDHQIPYRWRLYLPERHPGRLTEPELDRRVLKNALDYIGGHPLAPVKAAFHNTLRLLELEGSFAWESSVASIGLQRATARIGVVSFWILCLFALGGAFTRAARSAPRWPWLVALLFAFSVVLVNAETPRFRAPLDPFLILLAGCALQALVARAILRLRGAPVRREAGAPVPVQGAELVEMVERLA